MLPCGQQLVGVNSKNVIVKRLVILKVKEDADCGFIPSRDWGSGDIWDSIPPAFSLSHLRRTSNDPF